MRWSGKIALRTSWPHKYLLDNDLSPDIAKGLRIFKFDIQHITEVSDLASNTKDPEIFTWCSRNKRVWITHDIEANRKHEADLKSSRISVLWVRGHPEHSATWTLFKLIVRQIDQFQQKLDSAHGAIHYRITRGDKGLAFMWAESSNDRPKGIS